MGLECGDVLRKYIPSAGAQAYLTEPELAQMLT